MSHRKRAEDELRRLRAELETIRTFLQSGDPGHALVLLGNAESHLRRAADEVRRIREV